ncbi:MAG: glycoside hydrolase/phage tail family protein [Pseudomonadota bacterium]
MATLVLAAAGGAAGAALGGSVLGVGAATFGRAIGASLGRVIDQKLLGTGSQAVETGRIERFRLNAASEGTPIPHVYGRTRVAGQVIWASQFTEEAQTTSSGSGKGLSPPSAPRQSVTSYTYRVSVAYALCEGQISHVARVWADGEEIARDSLSMRVYTGGPSQQPDPKIAAVEGWENTPAYRGTAYVVFEDLDITQFGNRVPQLNFEVVRPKPADVHTGQGEMRDLVQAVAMIPGTGEYSLSTQPVYYDNGFGAAPVANVNAPGQTTDFIRSTRDLSVELPHCNSVSLVVSWFGDDLRCGECKVRPLVEQKEIDGSPSPWKVAGWTRECAGEVAKQSGRPVYGGTPSDPSVIEAIHSLRNSGKQVLFYPFILMDQLAGNGRTDPWTGAPHQPELPWRGRITLSVAPGRSGSPDRSAAAEAEVANFFGTASLSDFSVSGGEVIYSGAPEMSLRRFILHYAYLCQAAGGVDAFCIGSEMRALTQIRGASDSFPSVARFGSLLQDVRAVLGPGTKLSYASDWSEYFGYTPPEGNGAHFFHLDPLWAHPDTDFIGIDNYMPLSDWRDGSSHADSGAARSIYDPSYLESNVAGGEGYDWYYGDEEDIETQTRRAITDGAYNEPWVYRYKDLNSWWTSVHYDRPGGVRATTPTQWSPQSKPFWFTELGCAALDKGTNQPNKFLDPKSSESRLPRGSNGLRDDFIQLQYLRAVSRHWSKPQNNPISQSYGGAMVDMSYAHVWAWDARPYPYFPAQASVWSDGDNYDRGHWLNGRACSRSLASVVAEICRKSGITDYDVSELYGHVRGFNARFDQGARSVLQSLMTVHSFDAFEQNGRLVFKTRIGRPDHTLVSEGFAVGESGSAAPELQRASPMEGSERVRLSYVEADTNYPVRNVEAALPEKEAVSASQSETELVLSAGEARRTVERWLSESRLAREVVRFALPPSENDVRVGDVVAIDSMSGQDLYRVDRLEVDGARLIEATQIDPSVYEAAEGAIEPARLTSKPSAGPVFSVVMDLPLLPGRDVVEAPWIASSSEVWPGSVAVYGSATGEGFSALSTVGSSAVIGRTLDPLSFAAPGLIDRGPGLTVQLIRGSLASAERQALLNGANAMAIGDGSSDNWEIFQFETADLIAPLTYRLNSRLRGQLGTDALVPTVWPAGSKVVLLGTGLQQFSGTSIGRETETELLIGPAELSYNSSAYRRQSFTYDAVSLRPYAPVHLSVETEPGGDHKFRWVRRSRIDGDLWNLPEIPLGEDREAYWVRVSQNGETLLESSLSEPEWSLSLVARQAAGIAPGAYDFDVAQISDRYGPGLFRRITVDV